MEGMGKKGKIKIVEGIMDAKKYREVIRKEAIESVSMLFGDLILSFNKTMHLHIQQKRPNHFFAGG